MRVYVVTADYQRQENTEISLKAGERVEVIEKSESGEWHTSIHTQHSLVCTVGLKKVRSHC